MIGLLLGGLVASQVALQAATPLVAIDDNTLWRYDRSGQDLGTAWKEKGFNDSAWPQGAALLGEEGTTVDTMRTPISRYNDDGNYVTTFYFRIHFNYTGTAATQLRLTHVVDDGVVFYLNGAEVYRFGISPGASFNASTYFADHENVVAGPFTIPSWSLVQGDNVLAAEVHQATGSSSDVVFGAILEADNSALPRTTIDIINPLADMLDAPLDTAIEIALSDGSQKVLTNSIQLLVNGQAVTPTVNKPAGSFATRISYKPTASFSPGSKMSVRLVFSDNGTPPVVTTKDYSFSTKLDTVVLFGVDDTTLWRYDRSGNDLGTTWKDKNFNDTAWPEGAALLGDESSTVATMRTPFSRYNDIGEYVTTFYFRRHFNFTGSPGSAILRLRHVLDDGAVFYLNGVEVYRFDIPAGPVTYLTYASPDHENAWEGPFDLPTSSLVAGDNVIAVEVHQNSGSSSDIVFGAELLAGAVAAKPPVIESMSPLAGAVDVAADTTIQFTLADGTSKVVTNSIQLFVNGQTVSPTVDKPAGSTTTTKITYKPATSLTAGSKVSVKLVFSDDATPPNVTTKLFDFTVKAPTLLAIDDKTIWRYDRSGTDLGTAWKEKNFNDSAWPQGPALLGAESTTVVPMRTPFSRLDDAGQGIITFYFRTHFTYTGNPADAKLQLRHVVDDGAVFYLNGVEVSRFGLAAGATFDWTTLFADHENAWAGPFDISASSLVVGDNVFAAEVHQTGASSSDIVFGAELSNLAIAPSIAATMSIKRSGVDLVISWTGTGTLQSADAVIGPWSDITGAISPRTLTAPTRTKFYRVKQ